MNINIGDTFPEVSGTTHDGTLVRLADWRGKKNVVLYFYPKDMTPGCTREAIDFDRKLADFEARDAAVVGMSVDPVDSHKTFAQQCGLRFPLLSDVDQAVSQRLGILNEHHMAKRTTFVIGKDGRLAKAYAVQQVDGHVDEVLKDLAQLT